MFLHRRQDAKVSLYPTGVVVTDVALDHLDQVLLAGKTPAIIALPLQDTPEALHRTVVNAVRQTGHTLRHPRLLELMVKGSAGVLEAPVAVEQRMGIRVGLNSLVKGFVDKRVIIMFTECIGHDTPVIQIQNGAQVKLVYRNSFVPFELRYIGQPFFVGFVRIELAVQDILRNVLGILSTPGTAAVIVFYCRDPRYYPLSPGQVPRHDR